MQYRSWLVSTTYQDAMALFWTVSHVMTSTEGTDGKQYHECPLVNMILIGFQWLPIWSPKAGTTSLPAKLFFPSQPLEVLRSGEIKNCAIPSKIFTSIHVLLTWIGDWLGSNEISVKNQAQVISSKVHSLTNHNGLSKIPARVGGPGSDIINLGITIGGCNCLMPFIEIWCTLS